MGYQQRAPRIHFQLELQRPVCYGGRSENVTFERKDVTCKNCLDSLRRQSPAYKVSQDNWAKIYSDLGVTEQSITNPLREFLFTHPPWKGCKSLSNYPPTIHFTFWIPAKGKRRKSVGVNMQENTLEPNIIQVWVPTEDEMAPVATFVGQTAETHSLRAFRAQRDSPCLEYDLKPSYDSLKS